MYNFYLTNFVRPPRCTTQFLLTMKLTIFILITAILQVSATTYAQKVSLKGQNVPIDKVFDQISQQTGYDFLVTRSMINLAKPVNIDIKNANLDDALKQVFQGQPLDYAIKDKSIIVYQKQAIPTIPKKEASIQQPVIVTGKVQNELGELMPGVTIREKSNPNNGVITDAKGMFSITVSDENAAITFSYIGYESQELRAKDIPIGSSIILKPSPNNLKEVVVNKGYYSDKKELETGDVSSVSAKEIGEQPVSNPLAAMEGRVPGMFITQNTGVPGGSFTVTIRGKNSISQGNDPLYIVDGVPYSSELLPNLNQIGKSGNSLDFINPSDIESIDVLKDADATAIYGSRGANGVVLITTKKGKPGDMKVDFNISSGVGEVTRMNDLLNGQQYLQMRNEAFKNDRVTPSVFNAPDLLLWDTTRYTNWQKLLIGGTAKYTDAQGSISGGGANTQYLIGGTYHRETTVYPGDEADQKAAVHFSINSSSEDKKFNFLLTGNYMYDNSNLFNIDLVSDAETLPPDAPPIYNPNGSLNWAPITQGQSGTWINPFSLLMTKYNANTSNLVGHSVLSYNILPGLDFSTSLGYTVLQTAETVTTPLTSIDPGYNRTSGSSSFNNSNISTWIIEPKLSYKHVIGRGVLSALIGTTFQRISSLGQELNATGFTNDAFLSDIQAASTITPRSDVSSIYKYESIYGRLNYDLDDKYLLNLTARRDGSSRFGPANEFANFGAIGAGWIFSKESFIQNSLPFLSFGKIRASYGITGNDQIGDYSFLDLYSNTTYPYQGILGLYPTTLFNPNLQWEIDKKLEGGIDIGLFSNRITFNVSYYRSRSGNQLVTQPLSYVTGFTSIAANLPAVVQNTGLEAALSTINVKSKDFSWTSSFNFTDPKNKLISFPGLAANPSYKYTLVVGQPITILKVYHEIGINETTGTFQFASAGGNPTGSPSALTDRNTMINTAPQFYGGFHNSFQYKGFQLDILFQFVKQTGLEYLYTIMPGQQYNQPVDVLNRWTAPGTVAKFPAFTQNFFPGFLSYLSASSSDFTYGDASYLRLKNLSFSWQLPEDWRRRLHLQNCRIYLEGQNLLTITKYQGLDPENQGGTFALPPLRVITTGIEVTF